MKPTADFMVSLPMKPLAFFLTVFFLATAGRAITCTNLLQGSHLHTIKAHQGEWVSSIYAANDQEFTLSDLKALSFHWLGTGAEAAVYRVTPKTGQPYLLKVFSPGEEGGEQEALEQLRFWHQKISALKIISPLRVAEPTLGPVPYSLIFPDIQGETMRNIMKSDVYSSDLKAALVRRYASAFKDFLVAMTLTYPELMALASDEFALEDHLTALTEYAPLPEGTPLVSALKLQDTGQTQEINFTSPSNILYDVDKDLFYMIDGI